MFDETTGTLLCGDLFTRTGDGAGPRARRRPRRARARRRRPVRRHLPHPVDGPRRCGRLADLEPRTLALMHGPAFAGDGAGALRALADAYEARFTAAVPV